MAIPFTGTVDQANAILAAYDLQFDKQLRSLPSFDVVVQKRPVSLNNPSKTVTFEIRQDLTVNLSPIDEIVDPAGLTLPNPKTVTVTALDYGNYTQISKDLIQDTIDSGFDPSVTDRFAFLAAKTKDGLIEQVLSSAPNAVDMVGSTPTFRNASTTAATAATGVYTADAARLIVARLKAANVPTFDGQNYMAFIHPSVDADFRSSTDPAGWRYPQNYGMGDGLTGLITGEIGIFENVRYVVTNNASTTTFNGNTVYKTYVLGAEGVCGYELLPPQLVLNGTVIDPLDRKMVIGWKARLGYGIYRPEAIYAVFSTTNH